MQLAEFNFFPNTLSLFEITKRFFPNKRISHLSSHLKKSPLPEEYINFELGYVNSEIEQAEKEKNLLYEGFDAKRYGHDMSVFQLQFRFVCFRDNLSTQDTTGIRMIETLEKFKKDANLSFKTSSYEEIVERGFLNRLTDGVNLAEYKGYLVALQKQLTNPQFSIVNIATFSQIYLQQPLITQPNNAADNNTNIINEDRLLQSASKHDIIPELESKKVNDDSKGKRLKQALYPTFESLFFEVNDVSICVEALKNVEPPVVDSDCKYLLGRNDKGSLAAWISVLWINGYIKTNTGEVLAPLLNQKIPRLNLSADGKSLSSKGTRSYNQYITDFQAQLPKRSNK